uniref:Uncharacterized protein n=1 Tax=Picea glauca TaxID=3330 RepID=A0A117NIT6_PICGL|nr:hypothetical protein ABT39_MTgene321 [Picea glauca]QHR90681.1 hypothetical protein Q903MT_gene4706 [Picea sitchensis]
MSFQSILRIPPAHKKLYLMSVMHDLCGLMNWCASRRKNHRYTCLFGDLINSLPNQS